MTSKEVKMYKKLHLATIGALYSNYSAHEIFREDSKNGTEGQVLV